MPKTYSMTRKINLGKYGLQYEALDITVEGAESWEDAEAELNAERDKIHMAFTDTAKERLGELSAKPKLTFAEESERAALKKLNQELPF